MRIGSRHISRRQHVPRMMRPLSVGLCLTALVFATAILFLGTASAKAGQRVVVSVKPIHSLAAAVMAGIDTPYLIVRGAASPHSHALKPSDAAAIQSARIIFRVGGTFEQFLDAAIARRRNTTTVIELHEAAGVKTLPFRTGPAWGNAHGHTHNHDDDDHAFDPHIWLSPDNAAAIILAIAEALTKASPQHADVFTRNAEAALVRIHKLAVNIQSKLKPIGKRPYLVYHDAFPIF